MRSSMMRWIHNYEEARHAKYKQLREPSETFVSSKFDFQGGDWSQLNNTMIPSLGMQISQAISALKKTWRMYKTHLSRDEPTDQLSLRLLRLQAGLGLEQTTFLKEQLQQMGYTPSEIGEVELDAWETETEVSDWSEEDRRLLTEEQREKQNDILGTSVSEEESDSQDQEWTDLDRRMFQERLDAEREVPW